MIFPFLFLFSDLTSWIRLGVLPLELNKLLIIVVVLSMALTPLLNELGRKAADFVAETFEADTVSICQYDYLSGLVFLIVKTVTESWGFLKDFKIIFVGTRKHPTESTI